MHDIGDGQMRLNNIAVIYLLLPHNQFLFHLLFYLA